MKKSLLIGLALATILVVGLAVWLIQPPKPITYILVEQPQPVAVQTETEAPLPPEVVPQKPEETPTPPLTPREIRRLQGIEALFATAPSNVKEYVQNNGFPPTVLDESDPYYAVTFINPNGGGKRTRRAFSVHPITNEAGETNAYAIQYLKGQTPFVVTNDGKILVSEVIVPGGEK